MRDIKFKVFCDKHSREEVYTLGDLITGSAGSYNGEGGIFENWRQFTGLKDKNGKEIYEGDIVKATILTEEELKIKGQVIYCSCASYIVICENNDEYGLSWLDDLEVIGNIYENPELLED